MASLKGKIAWVTGAGSGIGKSGAMKLAEAGAHVVLTGRRKPQLEEVAKEIKAAGGGASVAPGDVTKEGAIARIAAGIEKKHGRIDILVNNAGMNIPERSWARLSPEGAQDVIETNLSSAFYCVIAVLPIMRRQKGGLIIHTASWAGRFVGGFSGAAYNAAKHGVVAMSHSINMEECVNGIRSTALCPGEVATPIMDRRPVPVSKDDLARMLQPEDMGDLILYVATRPPHVCINEVLISPSWNRGYVAALQGGAGQPAKRR